MSNLARALVIATAAHERQTRKDGSPYVLHPLRLMFAVEGEAAKILAVLHDVVEDTDWTLEGLAREGFADEILEALDLLTHRDEDSYDAYIAKIAANPLARKVKLADLEDNLDLKQLPKLMPKDLERTAKYHRHWTQLRAIERDGR